MAYTLENASILVVEDMQPMLNLTKSILSVFGFRRIHGAKSGVEALSIIKDHNPDIIITDWQMEPMNGLELIQIIRTRDDIPNPYVPVILMTGYSDRVRVEAARDTGVTEFLMKPYTSKDLYSRLVQIIEKPRQFVDCGSFFGPDRRRRKNFDYKGPYRRATDETEESKEIVEERQKVASEILSALRSTTKNI